ncbi:MAG: hypothetical protein Ct9H300mP1_35070 [Planctomycetaceae bacterium]|nr:MAG: hypothetical protein Ct9H300mP1_35070 [Planctomycetaceae bacterium]
MVQVKTPITGVSIAAPKCIGRCRLSPRRRPRPAPPRVSSSGLSRQVLDTPTSRLPENQSFSLAAATVRQVTPPKATMRHVRGLRVTNGRKVLDRPPLRSHGRQDGSPPPVLRVDGSWVSPGVFGAGILQTGPWCRVSHSQEFGNPPVTAMGGTCRPVSSSNPWQANPEPSRAVSSPNLQWCCRGTRHHAVRSRPCKSKTRSKRRLRKVASNFRHCLQPPLRR